VWGEAADPFTTTVKATINRLRLTLLYGALFLISGALLLMITYLLVRHASAESLLVRNGKPPKRISAGAAEHLLSDSHIPKGVTAGLREAADQAHRDHAEVLHQLLIQSGIALGLMATVSIGLGWLVAGRVLRPLRTMTATTR
jgi:hypothetical protein